MNTAQLVAPLLEQLAEQIAARVAELQRQNTESDQSDQTPWMGIANAALYLDWPRQRLYKLTAAGAIPHYKQDGRLLFHRQELDAWIRQFEQPIKRLATWPEQSYS